MLPFADKSELRTLFAARREDMGEGGRALASAAICERLEALCLSRRVTRVGAFWPYRSEVDLRSLIEKRGDWTWFFPRVTSTSPPRLAWGSDPLEPGLWGLMEPAFAQHFLPPVQLLLVPGLAFDEEGYRLGYGRGFFDALLEALPQDVITLGVAFECQLMDRLPLDPHDLPVQGLLTEKSLRWFEKPLQA